MRTTGENRNKVFSVYLFIVFLFIVSSSLLANIQDIDQPQRVWSKSAGEYPWFQEDDSTRAFALNPVTGNVLVGSFHSEGGIYILSHDNGEVVGKLAGSDEIITDFGVTSLAVTHSGKIFATNLTYEQNHVSHLYYWESEDADNYQVLTTNFDHRAGDWMDACEDAAGNVRIVISGPQFTRNPYVNYIYYNSSADGWSNTVLQMSGAPSSADNLRMATIAPQSHDEYEIWLKDISDEIYRFYLDGNYRERSLDAGSLTVMSNVIKTPDSTYIASAPTSGGGRLALYDVEEGRMLENHPFTNSNTNENATGDVDLAVINESLYMMVGVTNNSVSLYRSQQQLSDVPVHWQATASVDEPTRMDDENIWLTDLNEALTLARRENKKVLVYCYTPQAEMCQEYDNYFETSEFREKLHEYIPVRLNIAEETHYANDLNIFRVPSIIIMDHHEEEVLRITEPLEREELYNSL